MKFIVGYVLMFVATMVILAGVDTPKGEMGPEVWWVTVGLSIGWLSGSIITAAHANKWPWQMRP